jgi:hypothetical protein
MHFLLPNGTSKSKLECLGNWYMPPQYSQLLLIVQLSWVLPDTEPWANYYPLDKDTVVDLCRSGTLCFLALHPSWQLSECLLFCEICIKVFPLTWIIENLSNRNICQYYMMFTSKWTPNGLGAEWYKSIENCRDKMNIKFLKKPIIRNIMIFLCKWLSKGMP